MTTREMKIAMIAGAIGSTAGTVTTWVLFILGVWQV